MAEERTTTVEPREGATHTTVIERERRGGGIGWLVAIVVLIAAVIAIALIARGSGSEAAKDNAIANAANQVGGAAEQVGEAAQDAAGSLQQE